MKSPYTQLLKLAFEALQNAYCPYSRFRVGAALMTTDGTCFTGCNVENASFGLTICAERVALQSAIADGHRRFTALAVVAANSTPPYPCGACRQVLAEFCRPDFPIFLSCTKHKRRIVECRLDNLLPCQFKL